MSVELNTLFRTLKYWVHRYSEIKAKVKDATNTDVWGPTTQQMQQLAEATHDSEKRRIILRALWKRIHNPHSKEIQITKALDCMEYLTLHGTSAVLRDMRDHRASLATASRIDGAKRRVENLLELLNDPHKLQNEKHKAARTKSRVHVASPSFSREETAEKPRGVTSAPVRSRQDISKLYSVSDSPKKEVDMSIFIPNEASLRSANSSISEASSVYHLPPPPQSILLGDTRTY